MADNNQLIVLMPVYNDWKALGRLLSSLDRELESNGLRAEILLVDDGSTVSIPTNLADGKFGSLINIDILHLRRNLGHQRAIAVGLSYIAANRTFDYVVIMDCDGEDDPRDVPRLIRQCVADEGKNIIFAARTRRAEGVIFTGFYHLYRLMHFLLTGVRVRVGNFSALPRSLLRRLVAVSELWNHYAAAVYKAKLPTKLIPTQRRERLTGRSRMDPVALVVHGLSAMAVFGDRVGVRLLMLVFLAIISTLAALVSVVGIRLFTDLAIPGWTTYAAGLLFVMLIQMLLVVLMFAFMILASRDRTDIIPSRDYIHLVDDIQRVHGQKP